jgi:hypothetical protein
MFEILAAAGVTANKFVGSTIEEYGAILTDNIKIRRMENQIKNFYKVKQLVDKYNISIKSIDLKALFPYLNAVSLEEDDSLQEVWANLFVNYIDSSKNLLSTVFPDILSQLSSLDVEILRQMASNNGTLKLDDRYINPKAWTSKMLVNIERLRLIELAPDFAMSFRDQVNGDSGDSQSKKNYDAYYITEFGKEFIEACTR